MKIWLQSHTSLPLQAIAAAVLSVGVGKGVPDLARLPEKEAIEAFRDACRGELTAPLEFATFNFFWEDVPIFLLRQLIRHRVGTSFAEQSLRFALVSPDHVERFAREHVPELNDAQWQQFRACLEEQVAVYSRLIEEDNVPVQVARNLLGVWVPTHITTAFTYRALRDILSLRQTSQAHPAWQDAVTQIKALMAQIHPVLAEELRDICDLTGRCVWLSKLDRPCSACEARGLDANHHHRFTKFTDGYEYCACGVRQRWSQVAAT
jgi:flavin-dependent thymidylate synthase